MADVKEISRYVMLAGAKINPDMSVASFRTLQLDGQVGKDTWYLA